ncbi:MAG: helix-turn-helix domain-containing protein [Opitutales bacterium]|jgi:hypothetical protein
MRPIDEKRRTQIRRLYAAGLTLRQIGAALDVTYQAVHSMLERMGVPRRPRGGNQGAHSRRRK